MNWVQVKDPCKNVHSIITRCYIKSNKIIEPIVAIDIIGYDGLATLTCSVYVKIKDHWSAEGRNIPDGLEGEFDDMTKYAIKLTEETVAVNVD